MQVTLFLVTNKNDFSTLCHNYKNLNCVHNVNK